ncbi:hypothetical protein AGLY_013404 [Aphis glycines]|uniref:Uncharacterized protein n=1 Tax=Aphis glycines TaxID=307491 RepID=A0A6G0T6U5_APHGL|nr:hypothetical protein AGLY_013404 [Aphis glycines]
MIIIQNYLEHSTTHTIGVLTITNYNITTKITTQLLMVYVINILEFYLKIQLNLEQQLKYKPDNIFYCLTFVVLKPATVDTLSTIQKHNVWPCMVNPHAKEKEITCRTVEQWSATTGVPRKAKVWTPLIPKLFSTNFRLQNTGLGKELQFFALNFLVNYCYYYTICIDSERSEECISFTTIFFFIL